jgi:hypothetical protein
MNPASCPMGTGGFLMEVKRQRLEAHNSLPTSAEVKTAMQPITGHKTIFYTVHISNSSKISSQISTHSIDYGEKIYDLFPKNINLQIYIYIFYIGFEIHTEFITSLKSSRIQRPETR